MQFSLFTIIFPTILIICVIFIFAMIVSLSRQDDERRKMIISCACTNTFYITIIYLITDTIKNVIRVAIDGYDFIGINSFFLLTVISLVFSIELLYFKRKFGG